LLCCTSIKNANSVESEGVTIKLVETKGNRIPSNLDLDVKVVISNNHNYDVYFPKPIPPKDMYSVENPSFYNVNTYPEENCMLPDIAIKKQKRDLSTFFLLPKDSSTELTINPKRMNPGLWCGYKSNDTIQLQIIYMPEEKYFNPDYLLDGYGNIKDKEQLNLIYSKLPRAAIESQKISFVLE